MSAWPGWFGFGSAATLSCKIAWSSRLFRISEKGCGWCSVAFFLRGGKKEAFSYKHSRALRVQRDDCGNDVGGGNSIVNWNGVVGSNAGFPALRGNDIWVWE